MTNIPPPSEGSALSRIAAARNLSKAESQIAVWIERNFENVVFETAADLAEGAGVSEMTVSRFVRRLGYKNFKAFKTAIYLEFRDAHGAETLKRRRRVAIPESSDDGLGALLQSELDAIVEVYRMAQTDTWRSALDAVHMAGRVRVIGFQAVSGMAADFATRLKYARAGVGFADGRSGNWSELFLENADDSCVIMIETVPYAHEAVKVAEACVQRNVPLIVITDRYSAWPRQYTPHVLAVPTDTGAFLDSTAGISALLGIFLNGIAIKLGDATQDRIAEMHRLAQHFDPFTYEPGTPLRSPNDPLSTKAKA
ncbi:MurR/RpiR family transcriptional regulator [Sulfitobacter mediterraneus]|uniref:MurR/RpiR family transcriptional regulator n=1 Tax=Sulfitobacter mediterraneus TaxID=83219 RepID=UPI0019336BD4|nr:MurR/RpiR family transcriptional regulator [Sulfitobacter mediterraneus]MBM1635180.1 MurR/RpiR family transcriptional regulator [Sulfitobacter mediterraneus]MBM1643031.1 MurR/RpiR family transcriptional regulator [Sulfitobacter mediterraneus]MBM1647079.1 MurR/RpiR family transcriptional regulator [Sulfitobacter mediterraneus]MBM1651121.1 MurR/RpiR family transcriptional regulator [Sulfitobacter mediterraneus]MBM1655152.1 MurR/RpiR family transcriptional regulator [Sulfitobacter mediterraneu